MCRADVRTDLRDVALIEPVVDTLLQNSVGRAGGHRRIVTVLPRQWLSRRCHGAVRPVAAAGVAAPSRAGATIAPQEERCEELASPSPPDEPASPREVGNPE